MSLDATMDPVAPVTVGATKPREELVRNLLRSKLFVVGAAIMLFWVVCAVFGYVIAPQHPSTQDLSAANVPPGVGHWFGTDQLGRDVLSRVITGSRSILIIAPLATLLSTVAGTALGLVMGYFRGMIDEVIGRFVEAFLALPLLVTAVFGVVVFGRSNVALILVIASVFTPLIARTVRSAVLLERELDYVAAARLRGEGALYNMSVEVLPNILPPVVVEFSVRLGYAVFAIATLSFLGLGVQPPSPDWGLQIASNYSQLAAGYSWQVLFPAAALTSLVISVILVADAIEAVLD